MLHHATSAIGFKDFEVMQGPCPEGPLFSSQAEGKEGTAKASEGVSQIAVAT